MIIENNELAILDFSNTNPLQSNLNPDNLLDVSGINDRDGSSISPSISDLDQLTPTNFVDNNLLGDTVESPLGFESLTGGGAINPLDNLGLNDTSSANLDNLLGKEQFVSSDVSFIPSSTEIEPISLESDNQNIFSDLESNSNNLSTLDDNDLNTEIQGELEGAEDEGESESQEDILDELEDAEGEQENENIENSNEDNDEEGEEENEENEEIEDLFEDLFEGEGLDNSFLTNPVTSILGDPENPLAIGVSLSTTDNLRLLAGLGEDLFGDDDVNPALISGLLVDTANLGDEVNQTNNLANLPFLGSLLPNLNNNDLSNSLIAQGGLSPIANQSCAGIGEPLSNPALLERANLTQPNPNRPVDPLSLFRERFEQFSLRSLNITPNTTPKRTTVRSRSRNVVPDGLADLPQTLRGLRTGRVINRNFRDSIFYEAKTTERIRLSTGGDRQVAGFLDALNRSSAARFTRRNPTAPLNPVPTLVFLTPADTTIGNSTLGDARNKQIGIFQHVACDNPNGTPGVNDVVMGRGISLNPEIFTARGFAPVTLQQGQATFI